MSKPRILLSNDDGIHAPGLRVLYEVIRHIGHVTVAAPDTEQSSTGHSVTLKDPIRVKKINSDNGFFGYAVGGTPADCVKLALHVLLKHPPDLVISGINHGGNIALNVLYSGTVAAATEGAIYNIPSIAVSLVTRRPSTFDVAAEFAGRLAVKVLAEGLPHGTILNVNVPPGNSSDITGVQVTRQGSLKYGEKFIERTDPRNQTYYWLGGTGFTGEPDEGTDEYAIRRQMISVTPIQFDLTDHQFSSKVAAWDLHL